MKETYVLGINCFHGDSASAILKNGKIIAAVEEERFTRIKHTCDFPIQSIKYCLKEASINIESLDHIAINSNPLFNYKKKLLFAILNYPSISLLTLKNLH